MTADQPNTPNKKKPISFLQVFFPAISIIIGAVIILAVIRLDHFDSQPGDSEHEHGSGLDIGHILPDFKLETTKHETKQFSELAPKLTLINLWASWCSACVSELPSLVNLRTQFQGKGFDIFFVNIDKNPEKRAGQLMKQFGLEKLSSFIDPQGKLPELFDIQVVPFTLVLNRERKILFSLSGEGAWETLEFKKQIDGWLSE